ncbi:MAG: AAA family ATPase [Okeania sp. SIO3B5]|uniref:AAA family ATPase n=1 Tax=Okeania sp. SIO3B5 TaxID=2607811 RepID=UPI0013FF592D|nr:ATP-binding protein [Okeania sp. SIO3B5]NEO57547.1 AAA family ATPase [Okeania sp. SIO3B5]
MLKTVRLHNFKSHPETELEFDDSQLHALVGTNGSGKTSVLQALHYLSRLAEENNSSFKDVFQHENSPEFIVRKGQNQMSVSVSVFLEDNPIQNWELTLNWQRKDNSGWLPILSSNPKGNKRSDGQISLVSSALKEYWISSVYLKLIAANLAKAAYSDAVTPQIEFNGSCLAPNLDYLRNEAPDKFQSLQKMLQQVVPGVKRLGIRRAKVAVDRQRLIEVDGKSISYQESQEMAGQEIVFDMKSGDRIPAHAISEGTILALGLLTVLMNPNPPNLVLLDDVEQGLHPQAQRELMSVFKQIIEANPNLQIIFSTHSPYIVDELTPSQVHVLTNNNSGLTHCKRLDEHPDVEWAKQTLTTGEFWDAEGEDWVIAEETNE